MIESHGKDRRRRRIFLCVGWSVSVTGAVAVAAVLCSASSENYGIAATLVVVTLAVWHRWMKREGGVAVLIYHSVTAAGEWLPWSNEISVSPELFEEQLAALKKMRCTVMRTSELVEARQAGQPVGRRPVVIHFDDGYLDNWVAALPLLKQADQPATIFVSTDFVELGNTLRPTLDQLESGQVDASQLRWDGYLNWAELREMETSGLMDVECHGVDHGRVPVGPASEDILTEENWRRHAWMQWRHMRGSKSNWYRCNTPPFEPAGTPVPLSAPALSARAWIGGRTEDQETYEERVTDELRTSKRILEQRLGKVVRFFCWPFNTTNARAHELALESGFVATTGGDGENRPGEDASVISRFHVNAGILGRSSVAFDTFIFRANVRLLQGNYYWGVLILPINFVRRLQRLMKVGHNVESGSR